MTIKLPQLDDKTYADLVEEARATIPTVAPQWTDHNPSDPGIALVEMFAFLTEAIIYRTGRITEKTERSFLRLLSGGAHGQDNELDLAAATEATLRDLRRRYRAVTAQDYEELLRNDFPQANQIARGYCLVERDLTAPNRLAPAPGHVSLVVLPIGPNPWLAPATALVNAILDFFSERRVITTCLHVVGVQAVPISLSITVYLRDDAPPGATEQRTRISKAIFDHFDPVKGGPGSRGWPFGRDVDVADIFALVDQVDGVQFVDTAAATWSITAPNDSLGPRNVLAQDGRLLAVRIEAHELPQFSAGSINIILKERRGTTWQTIA